MNKEDDFFSHKKIARSMSKIFSDTYKDGTYVVAINGAWGTGKTNLMNSILSDLDDMEYIKVNFNAWRYAGQEDVKRALLICILEECKRYLRNETNRENLGWQEKEVEYVEQVYEDIERSLYTAFVKEIPGEISIDMGNLLRSGVNLALKFVPWGELGGEFISKLLVQKDTEGIGEDDIDELWNVFKRSSIKRNIEKVTGVEQFRKSFENLMEIIIEGNCEEKKTKSLLRLHNKNIKVVVAIDDLDRCLPETALEILESIKLFMDYPNTYFIIALDGNIIQEGLNIRYQECDSVKIRAKDYYEKMIDLSFNIPALLNDKMYEYIQSLSNESTKYIKLYDLLYIALGTNLRGWQRYIQRTDFNKKLLEDIAGLYGPESRRRTGSCR